MFQLSNCCLHYDRRKAGSTEGETHNHEQFASGTLHNNAWLICALCCNMACIGLIALFWKGSHRLVTFWEYFGIFDLVFLQASGIFAEQTGHPGLLPSTGQPG